MGIRALAFYNNGGNIHAISTYRLVHMKPSDDPGQLKCKILDSVHHFLWDRTVAHAASFNVFDHDSQRTRARAQVFAQLHRYS